jgi:hypothetical protein
MDAPNSANGYSLIGFVATDGIILPVILTTGVVNLPRAVLAGAPTTQDSGLYGSTKIRSSNTRQRRRANASFTQTRDFDFPILPAALCQVVDHQIDEMNLICG